MFKNRQNSKIFGDAGKEGQCNGRIHKKNTTVIKEVNIHSHEADAAIAKVPKVKTSLIRQEEDTIEPPSVAINKCASGISQSVQASMPRASSIKRLIRRKRNEISAFPPLVQMTLRI